MKPRLPSAGDLDRMTATVDTQMRPVVELTGRPRARRVLRILGYFSVALILALFGFGVVMVATMLAWGYVAIGVLVLAGVPLLMDALARRWRAFHVAALAPVAVLVPIVALLGVDVVWSWARFPHLSAAGGLFVAGIVVAAVAYAYLRWAGKESPPYHRLWALYILVASLGLATLTGHEVPQAKLWFTALAASAATWIYLHRPAGPEIKHPLWWALLLAGVAVVDGPLIAQAIKGGTLPVVLLIAGVVIAVLALLSALWSRRGDEARRHARRAFGVAILAGVVAPLIVLVLARAISDAGTLPEGEALPVADATAQLPPGALDHQPILLFDKDERFRTPLDVDRMLATGDVELCPEGKGLLADCRKLSSAADLRSDFGNMRFDTQTIEDDGLPTTIYAHAVADQLQPGWTDVDYWWYLADNPANTARGAMCGAGLVIPEITCFDHQSDWEGITVVLDQDQNAVAVRYAAHDHVVNVPWANLQAAVRKKGLQRYAPDHDMADHPPVFIARGSHAAYPLPCKSSTCQGNTVFEDNRHNGAHIWPEKECSPQGCVTAFPQTVDGHIASWNAFDRRWGSAICIVHRYCARTDAPRSPGRQPRFNRPWCYDFTADTNLERPRPVKRPGCEKKTKGDNAPR